MVNVNSGLNAFDILDGAIIRETLSSMLKLSSASIVLALLMWLINIKTLTALHIRSTLICRDEVIN